MILSFIPSAVRSLLNGPVSDLHKAGVPLALCRDLTKKAFEKLLDNQSRDFP